MSAVAWTVMKKRSSELVCWLWTYGLLLREKYYSTIVYAGLGFGFYLWFCFVGVFKCEGQS